MLRKIIGAAIGASVARNHKAAGGVAGAVAASAVPFVLSRLSLPTMVVLGVGGYAAKRWLDRQPPLTPALTPAQPAALPVPVQTPYGGE